jgi:hypothetical protein
MAFTGTQAITVIQASMVAQGSIVIGAIIAIQASGLAPWLADRRTMNAAQSVAGTAAGTHVVVFTAAGTGRQHL